MCVFHLLCRIERCTQIQTILKPLNRDDPNLYATIEFYDTKEFEESIVNIPRGKDESDDLYQRRLTRIRQTRETTVTNDTLSRHYYSTNDNDRKKITDKLHEFIADELYLIIVKHCIIYTNKLPGENYILLDVPGCDSPIREHYQSAINAIQNADAFLFLTDGQRPSLTKNQLDLLNEIQTGHFDGMKRAFGIITKLDLCQTLTKFHEHSQKTNDELKQNSFLSDHIFSVAANISLLEQTQSDRQTLETLKERIRPYGTLTQGFDQCKNALNHFIEYELPYSRYRLVTQMSQQKIHQYVQQTIELGQQMIPIDLKRESLDDYIKQINTEKWGEIYLKDRYEPTLARAARWQKETLAIQKKQLIQLLKKTFSERFYFYSKSVEEKDFPIEKLMLEEHDIALFQMDPTNIDKQQRGHIVVQMLQCVKNSSNDLAAFMYDKYVSQLERILNEISPEDGHVFQGQLTVQQCAIELKTLIIRSTHPLILAILRWPHVYQQNRIEATKEFLRIAPIVAFNLLDQSNNNSQRHQIVSFLKVLQSILDDFKANNEPNELLFALFRR